MEEEKIISQFQEQIEALRHDLQKAEQRIASEIAARKQVSAHSFLSKEYQG